MSKRQPVAVFVIAAACGGPAVESGTRVEKPPSLVVAPTRAAPVATPIPPATIDQRRCPEGATPVTGRNTHLKPELGGERQWCAHSDGTRHGYWRELFADGTPREQGGYWEGKKHGQWRTYFDGGALVSEEGYFLGEWHGWNRRYFPTGEVKLERRWVSGEMVGVMKHFERDGTLTGAMLTSGEHSLSVSISDDETEVVVAILKKGVVVERYVNGKGGPVTPGADGEDEEEAHHHPDHFPDPIYDAP